MYHIMSRRYLFSGALCQEKQTRHSGVSRMKFGLFGGAKSGGDASADSQSYRRFIDYVLAAEELGYQSLFVVEHHFTGNSQVSASLNLLSYIAGRTQRMRLGTAVVVLPWHNPVLVAEQV